MRESHEIPELSFMLGFNSYAFSVRTYHGQRTVLYLKKTKQKRIHLIERIFSYFIHRENLASFLMFIIVSFLFFFSFSHSCYVDYVHCR